MTLPSKTHRPLVLASVMAAMFMIAIEATIVSTAMPKIAAQLGDLHFYAWVFSAFLLTQTATTVVFGKLSDLYGRRPVLLVGIAVFLVGSLLCGFATSIPLLIVFRLIQGVGAGAIQPIGITVVGDLYSTQERGKIQGYLASVWGISSVLGPLAGALIVNNVSWAWIFWINLPIGLIAAAGFVLFLHEGVEHERRSIDVAGAVLFTVAIASLDDGADRGRDVDCRYALARAGLRRRRRAVRPAGAPRQGPDAGFQALGAAADPHLERHDASVRHDDHRAHHLSADLRPRRDGPVAAGGGLHPHHDGLRLAHRGHAGGAQLRALRAAADAALRRRADAGRAPWPSWC